MKLSTIKIILSSHILPNPLVVHTLDFVNFRKGIYEFLGFQRDGDEAQDDVLYISCSQSIGIIYNPALCVFFYLVLVYCPFQGTLSPYLPEVCFFRNVGYREPIGDVEGFGVLFVPAYFLYGSQILSFADDACLRVRGCGLIVYMEPSQRFPNPFELFKVSREGIWGRLCMKSFSHFFLYSSEFSMP